MALIDKFQKTGSIFSKITVTNFFKDVFAKGFTSKMQSTQHTGNKSKYSVLGKIIKYKP